MSRDRLRNEKRRMADPNARAARSEAYLDRVESLIEQRIREAQAAGQFDNLPGQGKPLANDPAYDLDGAGWLANRTLKQAGFVPEWIQMRKEIETERHEVKGALDAYREQAGTVDPSTPDGAALLNKLEERYMTLARQINTKIDLHNRNCPPGQSLTRFVEDATRRWK